MRAGIVALAAWLWPALAGAAPLPERTIMVALQVDREGLVLVGSAVKDRPYEARPETPPGRDVRLEVALLGPGGEREVQLREAPGLCLDHGPRAEDHVAGDTIRLHRETLIVEVPERAGFSRLEVSWLPGKEDLARVPLGTVSLDAPGLDLTAGTVHWPDEYEDRDVYAVFGSEAEVGKRINVVLVPDGYTYAEKSTMQAHAQALVDFFRSKTPYREHDPFLNYILVYAYSTESGTDQCDCSIVRDTAMRTRFPRQVATCGASDNRCLFYGTGNGGTSCDPVTSSVNIAAAELRAPAQDMTLVMVNTTRYGGCGGNRAVYSAGNGAAVEIAAHELGHSLAGLADEYTSMAACGAGAREINTSSNGVEGAWPEWIDFLGPPVEGAEYYTSCLYRPMQNCDMRQLGFPFCPVCNQQWALRFFAHPRVAPTAPIAGTSPSSPVTVQAGLSQTFSAITRLPILGATTSYAWLLQGPADPLPVVVANDGPEHVHSFSAPGSWTLTLTVVADTNFVMKERTGANRDEVAWAIEIAPVPEVHLLTASRSAADAAKVDLRFEDTGATAYNLYVSRLATSTPLRVAASEDGKRMCGLPVVPAADGMVEASDVDLDAGITGETSALFFLVTADNGPGVEGPLGGERTADAACPP